MVYTLSCTSSTVAITYPVDSKTGTLSGTANLQVYDATANKSVDTPAVAADGSITESGSRSCTSGNYTLTVTWNSDGSASASGAGTYNSTRLTPCTIAVSTGHGGKPKHSHEGGKKPHHA